MTIKQQGGIFGRNPTFNDVDVTTINTTGDVSIGDQLAIGTTEQNGQLHVYSGDSGASRNSNCNVFIENDGAAGISIGTPSANAGFLMFADEGGTGRGFIQYDHTTDYLNLAAAGSTRVSIQGNNIALNNGGGIDFSATSGTGTSELFDDYEEGGYTPALGSGVSTTSSTGLYTKIGNRCFFTADFTVGTTSNTGAAYISLPFSTTASAASAAGGQINWTNYGTATYSYILTSSNRFYFRSATGGALTYANISGKQFRISGNFEVA